MVKSLADNKFPIQSTKQYLEINLLIKLTNTLMYYCIILKPMRREIENNMTMQWSLTPNMYATLANLDY
jgi:hypothetical protein